MYIVCILLLCTHRVLVYGTLVYIGKLTIFESLVHTHTEMSLWEDLLICTLVCDYLKYLRQTIICLIGNCTLSLVCFNPQIKNIQN